MRETQLRELLTLSRWDQLDPAMQEEAAHAVASRLPEPFRFDGLEVHELGQQRHRVAFFLWKEARFALIPGGPATLGYAPGSFHPTAAQQESWEETRREYPDIFTEDAPVESLLEMELTPLRQVTLKPFLLEAVARELDSSRKESYRDYPGLTPPFTSAQIKEYLTRDGFRLPTSDEWEYACAAGSRTLWRWGDETPMIKMPVQSNAATWDVHLRPNAFGLVIGNDPVKWEFTTRKWVMRGGDGGLALRAESGRLVEWLTLAPSYFFERGQSLYAQGVDQVALRRAYRFVLRGKNKS